MWKIYHLGWIRSFAKIRKRFEFSGHHYIEHSVRMEWHKGILGTFSPKYELRENVCNEKSTNGKKRSEYRMYIIQLSESKGLKKWLLNVHIVRYKNLFPRISHLIIIYYIFMAFALKYRYIHCIKYLKIE